ncbi:MAG: hypothetical protein ACXWFZ_05080 [Nitrososphaeraceae archaeon]
MFTEKIITVNKDYYDKSNFKFILCDSCWWFDSILKDVSKISNQCPRCKKKKRMYVERITIY